MNNMINLLFNFFLENDIKRKGFFLIDLLLLFLVPDDSGRNNPAQMELSVTQCEGMMWLVEGMLLKLYPM